MSIFGSIKDAIFGSAKAGQAAAPPQGAGAPQQQPQQAGGQGLAGAGAATVDVDQALAARAEAKGGGLDYKRSIVDLMKLLDLDSSLGNRKALAAELGYQGELDGSAEMNIWLHRRVMAELEKNGGRVSAELKA